MKVVICGAGQVGANIAKYLAHEGNDVTIVDVDPHLVRDITDQLDVQGIAGFASHPHVLEQAGLRDADILIAVTHSDEVNMTACLVAHAVFDVPTKIARVRCNTCGGDHTYRTQASGSAGGGASTSRAPAAADSSPRTTWPASSASRLRGRFRCSSSSTAEFGVMPAARRRSGT